MSDRPRRGGPPAAVRAPDPHRISLSGRAAFGSSSRLQSSPSPAPCCRCFQSLTHKFVNSAARRPRRPVLAPMHLPKLQPPAVLPSHKYNKSPRPKTSTWPTWRSGSP